MNIHNRPSVVVQYFQPNFVLCTGPTRMRHLVAILERVKYTIKPLKYDKTQWPEYASELY
jgi:hypothetical protein